MEAEASWTAAGAAAAAAADGVFPMDPVRRLGCQIRLYLVKESCGELRGEGSGDSAPAELGELAIKPDPKAAGWIRRVRVGANPIERTPAQEGWVMGALEKIIMGFAERDGDKVVKIQLKRNEVVKPELGTTFDSLTEACDFYNLYSWKHGFGIRYGKSRLNPEKRKTMQEIVCQCSRKPLHENTRSCRHECSAMIRLLRTSDMGTRELRGEENKNWWSGTTNQLVY